MEAFHEALEDCNLGDLGYQGSRFTWSNKCQDESFTRERLDKAYANRGWNDFYNNVVV